VRGAVGTGPHRGLVRESPLHALLLAQLPVHLRLTIAPLPPPPPRLPADTVQPRSLAAILRLVANATDSRRAQLDGAPQYTLLLDIDRMVSAFGRGVSAQRANVMMDRLVRLAFVTAANSMPEAGADVALIHYLAATRNFGTVLVPFSPTYEGGPGADHAATVAMLVKTEPNRGRRNGCREESCALCKSECARLGRGTLAAVQAPSPPARDIYRLYRRVTRIGLSLLFTCTGFIETRPFCDGGGRDCVSDTGTRRRDKRVGGWGDQGGEEGRKGRVMRCDGPLGVARRTREDDTPT